MRISQAALSIKSFLFRVSKQIQEKEIIKYSTFKHVCFKQASNVLVASKNSFSTSLMRSKLNQVFLEWFYFICLWSCSIPNRFCSIDFCYWIFYGIEKRAKKKKFLNHPLFTSYFYFPFMTYSKPFWDSRVLVARDKTFMDRGVSFFSF